jgi:23S rRNA pseudouridine1911/1915/1917 synthase
VLQRLREAGPQLSWSECRQLLMLRRVLVNGVLCVSEARRLAPSDVLQILDEPAPPPPAPDQLTLWHVDSALVVVEKPAGLLTTRRPEEQRWPDDLKRLVPTLDELVQQRLAHRVRSRQQPSTGLWRLQRLDRGASGLVVFARTLRAFQVLFEQFRQHTAERHYWAIVSGTPHPGLYESRLVRDRGDGRRGSSQDGTHGTKAAMHVDVVETNGTWSWVRCLLRTGRTHQIRIQLSEAGHPVWGDLVYGANSAAGPSGHDDDDWYAEEEPSELAAPATSLGESQPVTTGQFDPTDVSRALTKAAKPGVISGMTGEVAVGHRTDLDPSAVSASVPLTASSALAPGAPATWSVSELGPSAIPRLGLHAAHLAFRHPADQAVQSFESGWPADLHRVIAECGLNPRLAPAALKS